MKKKLTKNKVYFKTVLIIFAVLLTAGIGKKLADNYVGSVTIAETDSEAENWKITKGANGNYNLKYSGNRRVKSVKAIQLVDLGIIVGGEKIMFSTTDAASKSWTEIENKTALPSKDEWQALQENCHWERGTNGYYVYKKKANGTYSTDTDNYIFLPDGDYWSGTESGDNAYCTSVANENINSLTEKTVTSVLPFRLVKRKSEYVSLEPAVIIYPNESKTLTITNTSGKTITWKSSDPTIATVNENTGEITGIKAGTVKISAFFDGDISTCEVTVIKKVESITISGGFVSSEANPYVWGSARTDNKTLTVSVLPTDATNQNVTWESDAENVTVDENGKITITAPNTSSSTSPLIITITATSVDGSDVKGEYKLYLANYVEIAGIKWYTYDSQTSCNWANRKNDMPSNGAVPTKVQFEKLINNSYTTITTTSTKCAMIKSNDGSNAYIILEPGTYWSDTEDTDYFAHTLVNSRQNFSDNEVTMSGSHQSFVGGRVRPIRK